MRENIRSRLLAMVGVFLVSAVGAFATTVMGTGVGMSKAESKRNALADLSHSISVSVRSDFFTYTASLGGKYKKNTQNKVRLSSSLPILSATFSLLDGVKMVRTVASISSEHSLQAYKNELARLKKEITTLQDTKEYTLLKQLHSHITSFNKHKIVAVMLGGEGLASIALTEAEVLKQIVALEKRVPSLDVLAEVLVKGVGQEKIYLATIKTQGSKQTTQFARVLKQKMSTRLKSVKRSVDAKYFLQGHYDILQDAIFVSVSVVDENNEIVVSNTATVDSKAYRGMSYKPTTKSFDEAMNSGVVRRGKLRVHLGFLGYDREDGIDFDAGERLAVVVKSNQPICYFLQGHILDKHKPYSYVLPIGSGGEPFVGRLTGEDVNVVTTILEGVEVASPYGSEALQIFAQTLPSNNKCSLKVPKCEENADGLCTTKDKPSKTISKTRALVVKNKLEKAEAKIEFTSFAK